MMMPTIKLVFCTRHSASGGCLATLLLPENHQSSANICISNSWQPVIAWHGVHRAAEQKSFTSEIILPDTIRGLARRSRSPCTRMHLAGLHKDDHQADGCPEDPAQHGGCCAHGVQARLDLPGGQPPHQQQAAHRPKGPTHLRTDDPLCRLQVTNASTRTHCKMQQYPIRV